MIKYIEKYIKSFNELKTIPLVCYFFTLRNLIVHAGIREIYHNLQSDQKAIDSRRFNIDMFQSFLLLEDGGFLLTEDGNRLILDSESVTDFDYVSRLNENEKISLQKKLQSSEAMDLLSEYKKNIDTFQSKLL